MDETPLQRAQAVTAELQQLAAIAGTIADDEAQADALAEVVTAADLVLYCWQQAARSAKSKVARIEDWKVGPEDMVRLKVATKEK